MNRKERQTIREVLHAAKGHFHEVCREAVDGKLQDVVDGMDISITKLEVLLGAFGRDSGSKRVRKARLG